MTIPLTGSRSPEGPSKAPQSHGDAVSPDSGTGAPGNPQRVISGTPDAFGTDTQVVAPRVCSRKHCTRTTDDPKWSACWPCWSSKRDALPESVPCPECGWPTSTKERSETENGWCRMCFESLQRSPWHDPDRAHDERGGEE